MRKWAGYLVGMLAFFVVALVAKELAPIVGWPLIWVVVGIVAVGAETVRRRRAARQD